MFLKCETTLNVYEHNYKNILCRVKVLSSRCGNNNKNESKHNTCRSMDEEQWSDFDKELHLWLQLNEIALSNNSKENAAEWNFNVGTHLRVQLRKSNLLIGDFLKCLQTEEGKYVDDNSAFPYVLDCTIEQTSMVVPPTPTIISDEYEPLPSTSKFNMSTISPLSYVPYTPSKRTRRFHSAYQVKTPGLYIRENELSDDIYSPKPIVETDTIAQYKPAPIYRRSVSFDSQLSNVNEVINETEDDERKDNEVYKTIRTKVRTKARKPKDLGEYVPQANLLELPIPAYKATPIEEDLKEKNIKSKKEKDKTFPKAQSEERKSPRNIKSIESHSKSDETVSKNGKENKDSELNRLSFKDSKKSLNSSYSSEDELEQALRIHSSKLKKKESRREKKKEENTEKKKVSLLENNGVKRKDKDYSKSKNIDEKSKNSKKYTDKYKEKTLSIPPSASSIRRSERSPSKPKRFIDEQEEECLKSRKKIKSHPSSPLKNKELFGTDDDDDDFVKIKSNNNNGSSNKCPVLQTPKQDKIKSSSSLLSSSSSISPSSSTKKKRKQARDCEQEKSGMSKWLGKKSSSSTPNSGDTKIKKSNENPASPSSKDPKSKVKKSKKERQKSPTPPPTLDIVMPSKEELEELRNKHKLQRERNEIVKAALQKLHAPPPKAVELLSLKDMTLNELLNTLDLYKNDLDGIYEKNCKKDHVKGNDGVNHCLVISLIDQRLQFKMLEKLSDVYNTTNNIAQATLFANALLPEWIVRIFMDKFHFSRHQAIEHIENQDAYRSYVDGQNDSTLQFYD